MKQLSKIRSQTVWIQISGVLILYNLLHHLLTQFPHLLKEICCSVCSVQLFVTLWIAARRASLPLLSPRVCSNSCPLSHCCNPTISSSGSPFSSCPQSFPASGLSQWVSSLHQVVLKYCSFSIRHSSEYLGLISFRIDWFNLLAVQGTLKSLL